MANWRLAPFPLWGDPGQPPPKWERGRVLISLSGEFPTPPGSMLLELSSIRKRFGGVHALRDGSLAVSEGQVHALLGENGAGKSTLMKIVAGLERRDGGDMRWKGRPVNFSVPADAHAVGIRMVHQESLLAPHLTVAENVFLGREPGRGPLLDRHAIEHGTAHLLASRRFPLEAHWRVQDLSPAQRQMVEICRALQGEASLLIFDEPTSSLSNAESMEVFRIVRELSATGIGFIYITHRLGELNSIADQVTILRDGSTVHSTPMAEISTDGIVHHMVGRKVKAIYEREKQTPGKVLLDVDLPGVKFNVRAGEIVGVAGLVGSGRTKVCETVFGISPGPPGSIAVDGIPRDIATPTAAVGSGIALITEDRQNTGLLVRLSVRENVTLTDLGKVSIAGVVRTRQERSVVGKLRQRLRIRSDGVDQSARQLSGGNQQKVAIAKWLFRDTNIVLFDEPTRGIDVGAKAEVFALMDRMVQQGKGLLMVSSELPELLQIADRILVMRKGAVVAELPRETTQEEIMRHATVGSKSAGSGRA